MYVCIYIYIHTCIYTCIHVYANTPAKPLSITTRFSPAGRSSALDCSFGYRPVSEMMIVAEW